MTKRVKLTKAQRLLLRDLGATDLILTTGSDRMAKSLADLGLAERDMAARPGVCIVTITPAVRAYLADRLYVTGSALTPAETAALLRRRRVPQAAADACSGQMARLDEALYRPDASASLPEILRALEALLPQIDAALDAPPPPQEDLP